MTDGELLELAAKAAGVAGEWFKMLGQFRIPGCYKDTWQIWNPLTDDGDALRLAVKLGLDILIQPTLDSSGNTTVFTPLKGEGLGLSDRIQEEYGDPYAATRRAIVRAAAEIGKVC